MLPPLSPDHVEYAIAGGTGAQVVDDRAQLTPAPSTGTGGFMQEKSAGEYRVRLWVPGDWNAFFGFFTNVALNVIVLTGLSLGVVKLPTDIVFGRILPALGIALPIGNIYYAYLAYRLAKRERRDDVAALPYGPSVPQFFICVFVVMLPTLLATGDPIKAWRAGLTWAFVIGVIVLIGAFVGPTIRRLTPRAAMLGSLAGTALAFISMRPAFQSWELPWIAFISLGIVMISWMARVRLPWGIPGGLAAVVIGTVIGWITALLGWSGYMQPSRVSQAFVHFGLHLPFPTGDAFVGMAEVMPLLITAIPLGIYNFTEGMNNVESASAAGDNYSLRNVLLADGIGAVVGATLGSPFPPAVYIGHPGWKSIGGRGGYSLATGICISLICFLGLTALLVAVIPLVAILPILVYIGVVITSQAFRESPPEHAPAVVLAIIPSIAVWGLGLVDGTLRAVGTTAEQLGMAKLGGVGVIYRGMQLLGGGAVLAGMMLGAIAAFIINKNFRMATFYALGAAALSFFGVIHGEKLGWAQSWPVALGYLLLGTLCAIMALREGAGEVADHTAAAKAAAAR